MALDLVPCLGFEVQRGLGLGFRPKALGLGRFRVEF